MTSLNCGRRSANGVQPAKMALAISRVKLPLKKRSLKRRLLIGCLSSAAGTPMCSSFLDPPAGPNIPLPRLLVTSSPGAMTQPTAIAQLSLFPLARSVGAHSSGRVPKSPRHNAKSIGPSTSYHPVTTLSRSRPFPVDISCYW